MLRERAELHVVEPEQVAAWNGRNGTQAGRDSGSNERVSARTFEKSELVDQTDQKTDTRKPHHVEKVKNHANTPCQRTKSRAVVVLSSADHRIDSRCESLEKAQARSNEQTIEQVKKNCVS